MAAAFLLKYTHILTAPRTRVRAQELCLKHKHADSTRFQTLMSICHLQSWKKTNSQAWKNRGKFHYFPTLLYEGLKIKATVRDLSNKAFEGT